MTVTVLLFASYADTLGRSQVELPVPDGSTVRDVVAGLDRLAGSGRLPAAPMVAVNERYASYDQVIGPGDEVAVIPPVAGG